MTTQVQQGAAGRRALTVLVVEDHDDTRAMMSHALARMGHRCVAAATCADARVLTAAVHRPGADGGGGEGGIDLVICDIGLPDGDGAELLRGLKVLLGCRTLLLTGYETDHAADHARALGADRYLVKPVRLEVLAKEIAALAPPAPLVPPRLAS